ncbi:class I SAM-dependent methyltransferase [Haloplasma contractile]|uniref:Trans-aconitate 2-methyltransferase protein n=1 Tax=Haloplasma contractile SSD-17B TaxID=1033810 RepID=U2E860_9MOLU|nr:class I SAM-dependent methyltransferase [Haloplasma contractile]ERJ11378.1 trans-aconitate 2-methyltransferase protein [Haloplasma contractile SSD-17B]
MDFLKVNQKVWEQKVADNYIWSQAVTSEEVEKAKNGDWNIVLTPKKHVPKDWFPKSLEGKKVLCLASGGGQQGPILAATGAEVTVFDYCEAQLGQDRLVAERDSLDIRTIQGDMRDLSVFEDESFDLIVHPWSNGYVDDVLPVWKEAYRVLKKGGTLISGFSNPVEFIFDLKEMLDGRLVVRHKLPYSDLTSISEEELQELVLNQGEGICFSHTLENQIQGQISAGFAIAGFYEDIGGTMLDQYMNGSIATKAIKL